MADKKPASDTGEPVRLRDPRSGSVVIVGSKYAEKLRKLGYGGADGDNDDDGDADPDETTRAPVTPPTPPTPHKAQGRPIRDRPQA